MAVTTVLTCPACQKKFKGRPELQGKKVRCPICQHAFVVDAPAMDQPNGDASPAKAPKAQSAGAAAPARPGVKTKPGTGPKPPPAPVAAAPPPPAADDDDEDGGAKLYGVTAVDLVPRCPHCASEMENVDAIICLECGYNTQTRMIGETKKVFETTTGEHFKWLLPGLLSFLSIVFLILGCLFFCLQLPLLVKKSWMSFLDHESMRMWVTMIALGAMWPAGFFAHKRLIMNPRPKEKKKE